MSVNEREEPAPTDEQEELFQIINKTLEMYRPLKIMPPAEQIVDDILEAGYAKSRSPAHKINRPDLLESALDLCDMYLNSLQPNGVGEDEPVIADAFSNTDLRLMYEALTVAGRSPAEVPPNWNEEVQKERERVRLDCRDYAVALTHDWDSEGKLAKARLAQLNASLDALSAAVWRSAQPHD